MDGVDTGSKHYGKGSLHRDWLTLILGLETAKLASLPESVMARAKMVANRLSEIEEEGEFSRKENVRVSPRYRPELKRCERHCQQEKDSARGTRGF